MTPRRIVVGKMISDAFQNKTATAQSDNGNFTKKVRSIEGLTNPVARFLAPLNGGSTLLQYSQHRIFQTVQLSALQNTKACLAEKLMRPDHLPVFWM